MQKLAMFFSMIAYYIKQILNDPDTFNKRLKKFYAHIKVRFSGRYSIKHWLYWIIRKTNIMHEDSNGRKYLIYVIYEPTGNLATYKLFFLESIADFVNEIVIVVNGRVSEADFTRLNKFGQVYTRENTGYDTAAFKFGIEHIGYDKLKVADELYLINDTIFGPIFPVEHMIETMKNKSVDFWGVTYGEKQLDFTNLNRYGYIPQHIQTYFVAIRHSLLTSNHFKNYWQQMIETNTREKAIGLHETVFTKYFEDKGFKSGAFATDFSDSAVFDHPIKLLKQGVPFIKSSSIKKFSLRQSNWSDRESDEDFANLINFIKNNSTYPVKYLQEFLDEENKKKCDEILIVDGTNGQIPQLDRYRIKNKKEQLESLGYKVRIRTASSLALSDCINSILIIIYRSVLTPILCVICKRATKLNIPILFEMDDLIIDTKYTDLLEYTQKLRIFEKKKYDQTVHSYQEMMKKTNGIIVSTNDLKKELEQYQLPIYVNRNLISHKLLEISNTVNFERSDPQNDQVILGYFSGSITHNENFDLIAEALAELLERYDQLAILIVGYLTIPNALKKFENRITFKKFVSWEQLPQLMKQVNINLAPLVDTVFNRSKSEIKWLEAALLKIPTAASNIGAFKDMVQDEKTGILIDDQEWVTKLAPIIESTKYRNDIGENAYRYVVDHCLTESHEDDLTDFIRDEVLN